MRAAATARLRSEPVHRLLASSPAGGRSVSAWARPSPGFGSPGPRPSPGAWEATVGRLRAPACAFFLGAPACRRAAPDSSSKSHPPPVKSPVKILDPTDEDRSSERCRPRLGPTLPFRSGTRACDFKIGALGCFLIAVGCRSQRRQQLGRGWFRETKRQEATS